MGIKQELERIGACEESLAWVGERDLDTAWAECPFGPWLLWILDQAEDFESGAASEESPRPYDTHAHDAAIAAWDDASAAYWNAIDSDLGVGASATAIRRALPTPTESVRRMIATQTATIASDTATSNATNTVTGED